MTIACCYVSPEGVVFGADSTTSYGLAGGPHYYNHAQKVFELGDGCTLGALFWGLAGLGAVSYRTLLAELDDDLVATPAATVAEVMGRWIAKFHPLYEAALMADAEVKPAVEEARRVFKMDPGQRSPQEFEHLVNVQRALTVGFCIGGRVPPDRTPAAYFVHFEPQMEVAPATGQVAMNGYEFWGAPNMFQRLILGADYDTRHSILNSGKWAGDEADLAATLAPHMLIHPILPLREVVDFVHACIHSTIKALKFSQYSQICGGPIELAVISTDRKFRWVWHKDWDVAVVDGDLS